MSKELWVTTRLDVREVAAGSAGTAPNLVLSGGEAKVWYLLTPAVFAWLDKRVTAMSRKVDPESPSYREMANFASRVRRHATENGWTNAEQSTPATWEPLTQADVEHLLLNPFTTPAAILERARQSATADVGRRQPLIPWFLEHLDALSRSEFPLTATGTITILHPQALYRNLIRTIALGPWADKPARDSLHRTLTRVKELFDKQQQQHETKNQAEPPNQKEARHADPTDAGTPGTPG